MKNNALKPKDEPPAKSMALGNACERPRCTMRRQGRGRRKKVRRATQFESSRDPVPTRRPQALLCKRLGHGREPTGAVYAPYVYRLQHEARPEQARHSYGAEQPRLEPILHAGADIYNA